VATGRGGAKQGPRGRWLALSSQSTPCTPAGVQGINDDTSKVALYEAADGDRGLLAMEDIAQGEVLVRVPLALALTDHPGDEDSNALCYEVGRVPRALRMTMMAYGRQPVGQVARTRHCRGPCGCRCWYLTGPPPPPCQLHHARLPAQDAPWSVRLAAKLVRMRQQGAQLPWAPYIQVGGGWTRLPAAALLVAHAAHALAAPNPCIAALLHCTQAPTNASPPCCTARRSQPMHRRPAALHAGPNQCIAALLHCTQAPTNASPPCCTARRPQPMHRRHAALHAGPNPYIAALLHCTQALPQEVPAPLQLMSWDDMQQIEYQPALDALYEHSWLVSDAFSRLSPEALGGGSEADFAWAMSVGGHPLHEPLHERWCCDVQLLLQGAGTACRVLCNLHHPVACAGALPLGPASPAAPPPPCPRPAGRPQVVHSRTFANAAEGGGVGVRMLCPLVDMFNHGGDETGGLLSAPAQPTDGVRSVPSCGCAATSAAPQPQLRGARLPLQPTGRTAGVLQAASCCCAIEARLRDTRRHAMCHAAVPA